MIVKDTPRRVILVEDSFGIAQALQRALGLHQEGAYQVETCSSGEAALQRLHESSFDLLLTDYRLPGIDGLELLERTRKISPGTRSVLITAFGSPEVEEGARKFANAYLPKPFHLQDLIRLVERVLGESPPSLERSIPGAVEVLEIQAQIPALEFGVGRAAKKTLHLTVLACDLDGTLAENGQVTSETYEALRAARLGGLVLVLVTGRILDSFIADFPGKELCDAIVAENGAVIYFPRWGTVNLPFGKLDPAFLKAIEASGVPLERGMAIASTWVPHHKSVMSTLQATHYGMTLEYNRNAVMMLPPGATKGSGLLAALQELGYSPHNVVACGDAENDRSLFEVSELGVAVSNAQPALRAIADVVLARPDGEGVQMLIGDLLDGRPLQRKRRAGRLLLLGYRMSGSPLYMDPFSLVENNLGIFGSSGSGKSWLAGLLAEELLKQKYQICIIDPEGDYRSLGASPHTLLLGGSAKQLPDVVDVLNIFEGSRFSLVLDLSMCTPAQKIEYVADFMRSLHGRRSRPHYFLIDEIQSFCPRSGGPLTDLFLETIQSGGFGVVSYRPSQVSPQLLAALNYFLITRLRLPSEFKALQPYMAHHKGGDSALEQLRTLPQGQAYLCLESTRQEGEPKKEMIRFRVGLRTVPHIRHLHKYLRAVLPQEKRFYFYNPDGSFLGYKAASLWEFREALGEVILESLQYHLRRGDFTRWLQDVLHDEELARRVHKLVDRNLEGEALRQALLKVVIERYEELDALK